MCVVGKRVNEIVGSNVAVPITFESGLLRYKGERMHVPKGCGLWIATLDDCEGEFYVTDVEETEMMEHACKSIYRMKKAGLSKEIIIQRIDHLAVQAEGVKKAMESDGPRFGFGI